MKTILVPTDFSEQAENALNFAAQIGRESGDSKVILLNIIEGVKETSTLNTMGESSGSNEEKFFLKLLVEKVKERLDAIQESEQYADINLVTQIELGSPYQSITKAIADHEADLVVMGTKGVSGIDEIFVGSNAERVVRLSDCPVITLREKVDFKEIDQIIFATDLREDQGDVIRGIKELLKLSNAKLHLLRVNTANHFQETHVTEELFKSVIEGHGLRDCESHIYNDVSEEEGILNFAAHFDNPMVAIGTHGRTGLRHLVKQSVAEDIVNHSAIPIWTMRMK